MDQTNMESDERVFKKTKIYENDKWEYYEDSWTSQYTHHVNLYDEHGIAFPDKLRVLKAESKTDSTQCYVAFDTRGRPVFDFNDSFDFDVRVMAYKLHLSEYYDIINMAKTKKDGKGGI